MIARWSSGEELPDGDVARLACIAEEHTGVLDGALEELSGIRRRALVRRLRELAGEGIADREATSELAARIEELPERPIITPEQERRLLAHLLSVGAQTEKQLAEALSSSGQIEEGRIARWADDAEDRGVIEKAEPGLALRRWLITDGGRAVLGVPSAL